MPYDLFGQVPVLESEIFDWVKAVAPHYLRPRHAFDNYVKSYDVPAKIRAAKIRGDYDDIVSKRREPWHARLALNRIT